MGWSSGSEILSQIIDVLEPKFSEGEAIDVYINLIDIFWNCDADTLDELVGRSVELDKALLMSEYVDQDYLNEYGVEESRR